MGPFLVVALEEVVEAGLLLQEGSFPDTWVTDYTGDMGNAPELKGPASSAPKKPYMPRLGVTGVGLRR